MYILFSVIIYWVIVGLVVWSRSIGILTNTPFAKGSGLAIVLFLIYILLLVILSISTVRSYNQRTFFKPGFIFSFSVGMSWGILISGSHGYAGIEIRSIYDIIESLVALCIVGFLFGGIGIVIMYVSEPFLRRLRS